MLLLTEADVRVLLPMQDLIDAMQTALASYSTGQVQQPLRTIMEVGASRAFLGLMPAYIPGSGALGTKLVTVFGGNAALGLPTHLATIILFDSETGALRAIMDGRYITEARTAAVSAVSVRLLAREQASTLALIGSGVQAHSHLEAISLVRPLKEVRVWSPTPEHRQQFAADARSLTEATVIPVSDARTAVADADLIVLVSSAREPVVQSEWVADGAHICAVGACRPDQREMSTDLVRRGRVFVDSRSGALAEAGDIVIPLKEGAFEAGHIAGELGELAAGRIGGRSKSSEVTIFKSLGMAVEDVAAAHLTFERAAERGLGRAMVV
jgi:ornithine cyclodeaminase